MSTPKSTAAIGKNSPFVNTTELSNGMNPQSLDIHILRA